MRGNKNQPGSPGRNQTQNPMQPPRAGQSPTPEREEEEEEESGQRREEEEESTSIGQGRGGQSPEPSSNVGSPGNQGRSGRGS